MAKEIGKHFLNMSLVFLGGVFVQSARMATSKYPTCGRVKIPHPLWATNRKNPPRLGEDFQRQKRV